jgi:two-component system, chemotaxis family, chemotaxis protein CheY
VGNDLIKILLVEDELTSRSILHSFLSPLGEVDIAVSGNAALTAVEKTVKNNKPYELIFLDIMLPELDGITALKKIRALETQYGLNEHTRSKIIMISYHTDKNVILKADRSGCTSYMIKPIDKTRLYNGICKHSIHIPE